MSYSKKQVLERQDRALEQFVSKIVGHYDDRVSAGIKTPEQWHDEFRSLVRPFGFEIVKLENRQQKEDDSLVAITHAIRQLNKIGKRVSIQSISKIVKMNYTRCRNLMVKYGMFDTNTKEIINILDVWHQEFDVPQW